MMKLSIGRAWDETSQFMAKEARLVAPVALAAFLVPATLIDWAFPGTGTGSGTVLLPMLLVLVLGFLGQMTIVALATQWRGSIGEAIGLAARQLPTLLAALIIVFLPIAIVSVFALAGLLGAAGLTDPSQLTPEAIAKIPSVGLLLVATLIVIMVVAARLLILPAVAINERLGPIALLKRCWRLTKGNFWRLLAVTLLVALAAAILGGAVEAVVGTGASLALGRPAPFNLSALLIGLASGLIGALISATSAALVGRIYAQLAAAPHAAA